VIGSWFREKIMPGAFAPVIGKNSDVRGTYNHDMILGRTTAGTMRLAEDPTGLSYEIDLNGADPLALGVASRIARKDVTGSSFGFRVKREEWVEPGEGTADLPLRIIHEFAELVDVGPVDFPAYEDTSSEARSTAALAIGDDSVPAAIRERIGLQINARRAVEARVGRVLSAANETDLKSARDLVDGVVKQVEKDGKNMRAAVPAVPAVVPVTGTRAAMTPDQGEEAAELVQYQTAAAALDRAAASLVAAQAVVASLIADETESPTETPEQEDTEEELETARLRSLLVTCSEICGAVGGVSALATAMLSDEYDPILWSRSAAADGDRERRLRLVKASL
jgi:hypothetical protein